MQKKEILKEIYEWIKTIVVAVAIALIMKNFIIVNANVVSGSMESTIMTGDRVLAWKLSYIKNEPKRGDIVIFNSTVDDSLFVKRIIGIGGDKIDIINGQVFINNEILVEKYLNEKAVGSFGPYYVPERHYFMMGDNRNWSDDSRVWENVERFVPYENIEGKVKFKYQIGIKSIT